MKAKRPTLKFAVAAFLLVGTALPVSGQQADLDALYGRLKEAGPGEAEAIVEKITAAWAQSGSPAMDLLLERGREALQAGRFDVAIEHFSALIDHDPDFAEAYHERATAFFRQKMYGPALDDLQHALALNPRHFGAMTGVAVMMEELGHDALSLRAWREVIAIHPNQEQAQEAIRRLEPAVEGRQL